ncbi:acyclic terpene utilization AtuA family protein [Paludibaculum fermentans]|uniref:acyclic terpene utilization AtuA family protein n=1 Tax=Paludibaculum fermentans TaxID=1473598 RepID=UPI003EC1156A
MSAPRVIRIANAQGFWGDSLEAPLLQMRQGAIDYLTLDYLAEVTMSILQKQRARDPKAGYARDFVEMIGRGAHEIVQRGIKVVANAGGVHPLACAEATALALGRAGISSSVKIGVVLGDDILPRLDQLLERGVPLAHLDTGEPLAAVRPRVQSANVYLGAAPIAKTLRLGAQIVITGRCADAALTLGPAVHEFGWRWDDWPRLAAGTVAGHAIECGAQSTGGNCQFDWESIPDFEHIGYPIAEIGEDGAVLITKHEGTGGRVNIPGVTEQLLYEIGDPAAYITPDVVADFTALELDQEGPDRVRIKGAAGHPPTDFYKVSISYTSGYRAIGLLVYGWPDAAKKARRAEQILRARLEQLGLAFDAIHADFIGANACHGDALSGPPHPDTPEVALRIGVRGGDRTAVERFTREIAPLALNGPPVVTYVGGRPKVEEVVAYWPALIPKSEVSWSVVMRESHA